MYILLTNIVQTTRLQESILNCFRFFCRQKIHAEKLKWTAEELIRKQNNVSFAHFGLDMDDVDFEIRAAIERTRKMKEENEYSDNFLPEFPDEAAEDKATLLIDVEVEDIREEKYFKVTQINYAKLMSRYGDLAIEFPMGLDQLNEVFHKIKYSRALWNKLLDAVNQRNYERVEKLLNHPFVQNSLNSLRYEMTFPQKIKTHFTSVYDSFRNNSSCNGSLSHYVEYPNTNQQSFILFQAILNEDEVIVDLLLKNGADTSLKCNGYTAIELAKALQNDNLVRLLSNESVHDERCRSISL